MGAEAVLKMIPHRQDPLSHIHFDQTPKAANPVQEELEKLDKDVPGLTPGDAAARWLKVVDANFAAESEHEKDGFPLHKGIPFRDLLAAIPPPADWPELRRQIKARVANPPSVKDSCLLLLADALTGNLDEQWSDSLLLQNALSKIKKVEPFGSEIPKTPWQIKEELARRIWDGPRLEDRALSQLRRAGKDIMVTVPDVLPLLGPAETSDLLSKMLFGRGVRLYFAGSTAKLARTIALQNIDSLKAAQWQLAESVDAAPLYEAMKKKFGQAGRTYVQTFSSNDYRLQAGYEEATWYYIAHFVLAGQSEKALHMLMDPSAPEYPPTGLTSVITSNPAFRGIGDRLAAMYLNDPRNPDARHWRKIAENLGSALDKQAVASGVAANRSAGQASHDIADLLSADKVDETLALIKSGQSFSDVGSMQTTEALLLASELGHKRELVEAAADAYHPSDIATENDVPLMLVSALTDIGDGPRAEELIAADLTKPHNDFRPLGLFGSDADLALLIHVYAEAGRYQDALTIAEKGPWRTHDIAFVGSGFNGAEQGLIPPYLDLAKSFDAIGQRTKALPLIKYTLKVRPQLDQAYAELLKNTPEGASDEILAIEKRAPWLATPLVWEAQLLFNRGDAEGAERTLRKAIAMEPVRTSGSGEDRARPYRLLAQVLKNKSDVQSAAAANRIADGRILSERAETAESVGMYAKAKDMLSKAIADDPNDYYSKVMLAKALQELGESDASRALVLQGLELLSSQGDRDTDMWPNDTALDTAPDIAEQAFRNVIQHNPSNVYAHYLLGYVYWNNDRFEQAASEWEKCLALRPDYAPAASHLATDTPTFVHVPNAIRDQAYIALLSANPDALALGTMPSQVTDYKRLWNLVAQTNPTGSNMFDTVYTLGSMNTDRPKLPSSFGPGWHQNTLAEEKLMSLIANYLELASSGSAIFMD